MSEKRFWSERILSLPPYVFSELDRTKKALREQGADLIDLSIGDPDLPTPKPLIEKCYEEMLRPENHRYPSYQGHPMLRKAIVRWFEQRFGVSLDADEEVLVLIGSKEGIAHAPLAFVNPGDTVLVPDIFYPIYSNVTSFAGGKVYSLPLKQGDRYLPKLSALPQDVAAQSRVMFLNYPNNPTAEIADAGFFEEVVHFAKTHQTLVLHDNAYSEVYVDEAPRSIFQTPGAKDHAIEFHSLSKSFNMTGWRLGFAVGNRDAISALAKVKTNVDSSVFQPIQLAGAYGLEHSTLFVEENNSVLRMRVRMVSQALSEMGVSFTAPKATFYFWCKTPSGYASSAEFCKDMMARAHVVMTPGNGFGPGGEGYFRISVTAHEQRLQEAMRRLKEVLGGVSSPGR